MVIELEIPQMF